MPALRRLALVAVVGTVVSMGVSACMERPTEIPAAAPLVAEGTSKLSYTAPEDGFVYVWDQWQDKMIYSGNLDKGQSITLDPEGGRVMVEGKVAAERVVRGGNNNRIFFEPKREESGRIERTVEIPAGYMERPAEIPAAAPLVAEGSSRLSYTAPADGSVYVWDQWQSKMIYSGHVDKGQSITLDPEAGRVLLDGKVAAEGVVRGGGNNRIFFGPTPEETGRSMSTTQPALR